MTQPQQGWAPQQGQPQQYNPADYQQQSPQGYAPPVQPAYAGPPQGYAPPPQQGYAPQPPYQQGPPQQMPYPPQQGYGGGYGPAPQQGGWGAPQGQEPPQGPKPAAGSLADFYAQPSTGWGPGLPWKGAPVGTSYTFVVARELTDADTEHQTKFGKDNELDYFRDGSPKRVLKIPGNIEPSQTFPDGRCQCYIGGSERDELARAMSEAGVEPGPPEAGARITITLTHHRKTKYETMSAIKHIQYTARDGRSSSPAPAIAPQPGYGGPPQGYGQPQYPYQPPQQQPVYQQPAQQYAPQPEQPAYQPPAQQPPQQYAPQPEQQQYQPQQQAPAQQPAQQSPAQPQYQPPAGPPPQQPGVEQTQQQPAQPQGQVPPAPGANGELDPARAAKIAQLAGQ